MSYLGWDVHAYGPLFTAELRKFCANKNINLYDSVSVDHFNAVIAQMYECYKCSPVLVEVLRKFTARYSAQAGGYYDNELGGINAARVIQEAWSVTLRTQEFNVLADVLAEIGSTCVQGDTFRLVSYWWGLLDSIDMIAAKSIVQLQ